MIQMTCENPDINSLAAYSHPWSQMGAIDKELHVAQRQYESLILTWSERMYRCGSRRSRFDSPSASSCIQKAQGKFRVPGEAPMCDNHSPVGERRTAILGRIIETWDDLSSVDCWKRQVAGATGGRTQRGFPVKRLNPFPKILLVAAENR